MRSAYDAAVSPEGLMMFAVSKYRQLKKYEFRAEQVSIRVNVAVQRIPQDQMNEYVRRTNEIDEEFERKAV